MTTPEVRETSKIYVCGELVRSESGRYDPAVDRILLCDGWTAKYTALLSSVNPVASSYFDFSLPEPMGVVGVVCPKSPALLGVATRVLPVIANGNTTIVLLPELDSLPALELAEILATSHARPASSTCSQAERTSSSPTSRATWASTPSPPSPRR